MEQAEFVVVGGGVMGAATGWALARAGRAPIVLERFGPRHTHGASHGVCRNFNVMYHERHYVDMLVESRRLWDELSETTGQQLLELVGMVKHGDFRDGPLVAAALQRAGIGAEYLAPAEAEERWPGMKFEGQVVYSRESGRVRADDSVTAMLHEVDRLGGEVRRHQRVTAVTEDSDHVVVTAETGDRVQEIQANVAIVTVGAWTHRLLGSRMQLPLAGVNQVQPAHFDVPAAAAQWPSFMQVAPTVQGSPLEGEEIYGLYETGIGVKVGWHGRGLPVDPDHRNDSYDERELAELLAYVADWLPAADPASARLISCTYTNTRDSRFVLDRAGRIVVGAGFSGHGFKFAPAVGAALAALAMGTESPDPVFAIAAHA